MRKGGRYKHESGKEYRWDVKNSEWIYVRTLQPEASDSVPSIEVSGAEAVPQHEGEK